MEKQQKFKISTVETLDIALLEIGAILEKIIR